MCKIQEESSGKTHLYLCPNRKHIDGETGQDDIIPTFYSFQHALDSGWIFTQGPQWSKDGDVVGLCPECASIAKG
jgi:hypothetical protein